MQSREVHCSLLQSNTTSGIAFARLNELPEDEDILPADQLLYLQRKESRDRRSIMLLWLEKHIMT